MKIPRKIPLISKYLLLNARVVALLSVIVIGLITIIVLKEWHKSLLTEFQIILVILSVSLFLFLFVGLYRGIRLQKDPPPNPQLENIELPDPKQFKDFSGILEIATGEGGIFGIILVAFVWLIISVFMILWYPEFSLLLAVIFYWLFYWAYRVVFRHSKTSKGNLSKSLLFSSAYTLLYSSWFFILIQAIKYFRY